MNSRAVDILNAVVQEYIRTGEPVSSQAIEQRYDFGVKAATIRSVMHHLTEAGLLEQPHTSGGRMPTDRGYTLFVEHVFELPAQPRMERDVRQLADALFGGEFDDFVDDFAQRLNVLGASYAADFYHSGFDRLVEQLEIESRAMFSEIARDFEHLSDAIAEHRAALARDTKQEPRVFIGKSPVTKSDHLSVVIDSCAVDGENVLLFAIGPKRMDYEKTIKTMKMLRHPRHRERTE